VSKSTLLKQRMTKILQSRQGVLTVTTHLYRLQQTSTNWVTSSLVILNNLAPSAGNTGHWTHAFISYQEQHLQFAHSQSILDHITFTSNKNFTDSPWNPATWLPDYDLQFNTSTRRPSKCIFPRCRGWLSISSDSFALPNYHCLVIHPHIANGLWSTNWWCQRVYLVLLTVSKYIAVCITTTCDGRN